MQDVPEPEVTAPLPQRAESDRPTPALLCKCMRRECANPHAADLPPTGRTVTNLRAAMRTIT